MTHAFVSCPPLTPGAAMLLCRARHACRRPRRVPLSSRAPVPGEAPGSVAGNHQPVVQTCRIQHPDFLQKKVSRCLSIVDHGCSGSYWLGSIPVCGLWNPGGWWFCLATHGNLPDWPHEVAPMDPQTSRMDPAGLHCCALAVLWAPIVGTLLTEL